MYNEISLQNSIIQPVNPHLRDDPAIECDVLRLDLIHPVISGNKFFKLRYYLEIALQEKSLGILTFGGAYSNHILATAFAGKKAGLPSIGVIRGEMPAALSPTLQDAQELGMKLIFTERDVFRSISHGLPSTMDQLYPGYTIIPEGGYGIPGMHGASTIHDLIPENRYHWIICACGTGTMMAGLLHASANDEQVMGIPVLKNYTDMERDIRKLLSVNEQDKKITLDHNYHFGGYAKKTTELIDFMNAFYRSTGIPTDFIYTGKLMYALNDLIKKGFFPAGSRILAIHSGGLQGNRSLKNGILAF
jgi:1-aminocyclopropane-1-carboxylate deaminase/D-cysteine desulfhydrase-like pyridoxal-dependent ACC family enzyme